MRTVNMIFLMHLKQMLNLYQPTLTIFFHGYPVLEPQDVRLGDADDLASESNWKPALHPAVPEPHGELGGHAGDRIHAGYGREITGDQNKIKHWELISIE